MITIFSVTLGVNVKPRIGGWSWFSKGTSIAGPLAPTMPSAIMAVAFAPDTTGTLSWGVSLFILGPGVAIKILPVFGDSLRELWENKAPAPPPVDDKFYPSFSKLGPLPEPADESELSPTYVFSVYSIPSPAALWVGMVILSS